MKTELSKPSTANPASGHKGKPRRSSSKLILVSIFILGGIGVVIALGGSEGEAVPVTPSPSTPASEWVDIAHPFQLYALPSPQFGDKPGDYRARRRSDRDERQDILTFGSFGDPGGYLRVMVDRSNAAKPEPSAFFVSMARQAADTGLAVANSKEPDQLRTSFGTLDVADLRVADPRQQASCLGFRRRGDADGVQIEGLACGPARQPIDRTSLACLVERLDLVAAGDDHDLAAFFAKAELNRNPACLNGSMNATPARVTPNTTAPAPDIAAAPLRTSLGCSEQRPHHPRAKHVSTC